MEPTANTPSPHPKRLLLVEDDDAQRMLRKVPFFVRGRVQRNTEKFAADQGHSRITVDVLQAA